MKQLHIITDLQYGSTGKGLFSGYLANRLKPDTLITAWGPNSGHTYIDRYGNKHVNIMIANGVVAPSVEQILIGPGSIVEPARLMEEMTRYNLVGSFRACKLWIHEHAAVVTQEHRDAEAKYGFGIGSTMKGVGEAIIQKIRRTNHGNMNVAREALKGTPLESHIVDVATYNGLIGASDIAILEGAQGFSLSINQGMYPYTTSRDCTTHQLLSDCGIPHSDGLGVGRRATYIYGVARTFPIRVANRYGKCECWMGFATPAKNCVRCEGTGQRLIGTSGPCYPDQREIEWADIKRDPELTTVTKLPRRIFTFSGQQIRQAIRMNGVDSVFLNFCNYALSDDDLLHIMRVIESAGGDVRWTGWGPRETDIKQADNVTLPIDRRTYINA